MTVIHAVCDAVSINRFLDDLEELLAGNGAESGSVIPYSVLADVYHLHKAGAAEQIRKAYQMDKFKQLDGIEPLSLATSNRPWLHDRRRRRMETPRRNA